MSKINLDSLHEALIRADVAADIVQRQCEHSNAAREVPAVHQAAKDAVDAVKRVSQILGMTFQLEMKRQEQEAQRQREEADKKTQANGSELTGSDDKPSSEAVH